MTNSMPHHIGFSNWDESMLAACGGQVVSVESVESVVYYSVTAKSPWQFSRLSSTKLYNHNECSLVESARCAHFRQTLDSPT